MQENETISSELRLLIMLCRTNFKKETINRIRGKIVLEISWELFLRSAIRHGVSALTWHNLKSLGLDQYVPQSNTDFLEKALLKNLARNTAIYRLLDEVVKTASESGIKVIILKGLALESTLYGNRGFRQMNDLDILVRKEDAIRLRKLLLSAGFSSQPMVSPLHEKILPAYGKHLPEMYKGGLSVEIHHKLFEEKGWKTTDLLIARAEKVENNPFLFTPDSLMSFLYLVKHLNYHEQGRVTQLRLYTDLHLLLAAFGENILNRELLELSIRLGLKDQICRKLLILNEFWDNDITNVWIKEVEKYDRKTVLGEFINLISKSREEGVERKGGGLFKPLHEMESFYEKLLFVTGSLFPSLEFMKFRYKTSSSIKALSFYPFRLISFFVPAISRKMTPFK